MAGKDQLLVALDVDTPGRAVSLSQQLRGRVGGFKIGSQLFTLGGPQMVEQIDRSFLDLKFHDIPNTVAGAAKAAATIGAKMFNVHSLGGPEMMRAARKAVDEFFNEKGWRPFVIAVTILTSHDRASLDRLGIRPNATMEEIVRDLAIMAAESGLDGVVCSPQEIEVVRSAICDESFLVVTPGIRSSKDQKGDQKRTMSAAEAVRRGASYVVVGRPIIEQPDPAMAADSIVDEIDTVAA